MYKINIDELQPVEVTEDNAQAAQVQWLLAEGKGAPNFAMRRFIIAPGGCTPYHSHPWEHEVYCLKGEATAKTEQGDVPVRAGDAILVEPDELHNFVNTGDGPLEFLCLVPNGPATKGH